MEKPKISRETVQKCLIALLESKRLNLFLNWGITLLALTLLLHISYQTYYEIPFETTPVLPKPDLSEINLFVCRAGVELDDALKSNAD